MYPFNVSQPGSQPESISLESKSPEYRSVDEGQTSLPSESLAPQKTQEGEKTERIAEKTLPKESFEKVVQEAIQEAIQEKSPKREVQKIEVSEDEVAKLTSLVASLTITEHPFLCKLSKGELLPLIKDTSAWLASPKLRSAKRKLEFLEEILQIPQNARAAFCQATTPLLDIDMGPVDDLLRVLHHVYTRFLQTEWADLIKVTGPLFYPEDIPNLNLLSCMEKIPHADRHGFIQELRPLFSENNRANTQLVAAMYLLPQGERAALIKDTAPLLSKTMSADEKIGLLEFMSKLPHTERASFIPETQLLFGVITDPIRRGLFIELLESLCRASPEERPFIIKDIASFLPTTPLNHNDLKELIRTLSSIEKEQRSEFLKQLGAVYATLHNAAPDNTSFIFYLLPESLKTQEKLSSVAKFLEDPEYQFAIISSLGEKLVDAATPPVMLLEMARFVETNSQILNIHEDYTVMQHALEILAAHAIAGEKNPYVLYKQLKALAKTPTSFQPESCQVAGRATAFSLAGLQAVAKAFIVLRSELPKEATEEAWQQLTQGFKTKIESDPQAKKQLENEYGTTWDELWKGCLSDPYLSSLLKLSEGGVRVEESQFRAILQHLLTKDKTVHPGKQFSEQEDILIRQAMSIQFCSGGKKEGMALIYKTLDPHYQYPAKGLEGGDPDQIRAKGYLALLVQKILLDQFSGTNALMQELTGDKNVQQASHQAIYLKNLIGLLAGLNYEVSFDKHTNMLYDSLVQKSREEVLQVFFRHMTPLVLVKELVQTVNSNFSEHLKALYHLTTKTKDPSMAQEMQNSGWDMNDDGDKLLGINELGSFLMLKEGGYLT